MSTTNYNLPQWQNGDEFKVIGQLNPAFMSIDTELHATKTTADSAKTDAQKAISDAKKADQSAQSAQSAANTALTTARAAKSSADAKVAYGKVKLVEDSDGNGVIVTLGVVNG